MLRTRLPPSFGEIPYSLVGRRDETQRITRAFEREGRDPHLSTPITGARGAGKTALLGYAARAAEERGWISVSTYAVPGMLAMIYESVCDATAHIIDTDFHVRLPGITMGPISASWERPSGVQPSWHTRMSRLIERLSERGAGLPITVDEIRADLDEIITFVSSYQIIPISPHSGSQFLVVFDLGRTV